MVIFRLMLISSFIFHTKSFSSSINLGAARQIRLLASQGKTSIQQHQKKNFFTASSPSSPSSSSRLNMSSSSSSVDIASNLQFVKDSVTKCVEECNRPEGSVKLVAVSKTKPVELLMDAYDVSAKQ
jgi:hypothetical protein